MDSVHVIILFAVFGLLIHKPSLAVDSQSCLCQPLRKPVCGRDGVTYANPCEALCAGTSVRDYGRCERTVVRSVTYRNQNPWRPVFNHLEPERLSSALNDRADSLCLTCESNERFVCGSDGQTYANADCAIKCGGVSVAHEGQCGPRYAPSRYRPTCHCPTISWPVCGKDGSTYSNPCRAFCRNVAVASDGPCELQAIERIRRRILGLRERRRRR